MRCGYAVLGALALVPEEGGPVQPGGPKQRELLGLLLLHRDRPVASDRLVTALWGDDAPDSAEVTLRSHVSHLRRKLAETLPGSAVVTGPTGYTLVTGDAVLATDRPAGTRALSGGLSATGSTGVRMLESAPADNGVGWITVVKNVGTTTQTIYAWVTCAESGSTG